MPSACWRCILRDAKPLAVTRAPACQASACRGQAAASADAHFSCDTHARADTGRGTQVALMGAVWPEFRVTAQEVIHGERERPQPESEKPIGSEGQEPGPPRSEHGNAE